jgi:predicted  nucleic acid-binding Zn-ribbon protein
MTYFPARDLSPSDGLSGMWDGLDKLIELQKLDVAIAKLDAEARAIPKTLEALEGRLDKAREAFEVAKGRSDQLQKDRRAKERELEDAAQNAKKKQARLFEIKTNEEYSAVLKEIEALKVKSSQLETEVLEQMEAADLTTKTVAEAERVFKTAQFDVQTERREKEARLATLQKELADLEATRSGQASRLDGDLLRMYSRLMKSRDVAVVSVADGSCQGCGMTLTPQTYNEVKRNDRMFTCPSCNRILYFPG